jgi:hypothetical protein
MANSSPWLFKTWRVGVSFVVALCLWPGDAINAQSVLFDLDTGTPPLGTGSGLPFDQTAGGITAHFSSPSGSSFSLQSDGTTFFRLSQFSGKYLYPNNQNRNVLSVGFSQPLTGVSLVFATVEYQDNAEIPSNILLTAYSGGTAVGTATVNGAYLGDTYPMGTLTFSLTAQTFDAIEIVVPYTPVGTTVFLADNIIVQTAAAGVAGSVPDGASVPGSPLIVESGIGGAINLYWSPSCRSTDVDYGVYEGTLGDFTSHVPRACSTSGMTTATIVPGAGNMYYLVVPHDGAVEGSYGKDSASVERPASQSACFAQSIGTCP